jgi:hypothetical protein
MLTLNLCGTIRKFRLFNSRDRPAVGLLSTTQ